MVTESTISLSPASRHRWGVFWLSVIFVPCRLLGSFFWAYLRGVPKSRRGYVGVAPVPRGVRSKTSGPPFVHGERFGSSLSSSPGGFSVPLFLHTHGGSSFSSFPSSRHRGGSSSSSSLSGIMGAHGIFILATYFGGLCFFGQSPVCHS